MRLLEKRLEASRPVGEVSLRNVSAGKMSWHQKKERVVFRGRTSAPSSMSYVTFPELGRETGIKAGGLQPRTAVSKILSVRIC